LAPEPLWLLSEGDESWCTGSVLLPHSPSPLRRRTNNSSFPSLQHFQPEVAAFCVLYISFGKIIRALQVTCKGIIFVHRAAPKRTCLYPYALHKLFLPICFYLLTSLSYDDPVCFPLRSGHFLKCFQDLSSEQQTFLSPRLTLKIITSACVMLC